MTHAKHQPRPTRRDFIASSVALATTLHLRKAAWALGASPSAAVCRLNAEQEVGPYYVADELLRASISEDKPGIPLSLRLLILDARTCKPLTNAAVDIWHCDALGVYSGYTKQSLGGPGDHGGPDIPRGPDTRGGTSGPPSSFGGPGGPVEPDGPRGPGFAGPGAGPGFGAPPQPRTTDKLTFLRGIQLTDAGGAVRFQTIFPGFYQGRTNHIHFRVRLDGHLAHRATGETYQAGHISHTGQVFFPEEIAATLMQQEPYSRHPIHRTTQSEDGVFGNQGGALSIAHLEPASPGAPHQGMHAELIAAVDPTATPVPANRGFRAGPGPGRGRPGLGSGPA